MLKSKVESLELEKKKIHKELQILSNSKNSEHQDNVGRF